MNKKLKKFGKILAELAVYMVSIAILLSVVVPVIDVYGADPSGNTPGTSTDPTGQVATPTAQSGSDWGRIVPLAPQYDYQKYGNVAYVDVESSNDPATILKKFVDGLFRNLKYVLGAIAVLFIILASVKLIISGDNEEVVTKQKKALTYAIIGLAIIGFSSEVSKVFSLACAPGDTQCAEGGFLKDPATMMNQAALFKSQTRILITFIKYLIGSIAVLMLVRNGLRLIALAGKEESIALDKKNVAYTSIGLVMIILASTVIDKVLYVVDITKYNRSTGVETGISPQRGMAELAGITNYAVSFVAPIAILVLIAGGVMYATAAGNDEKMGKAKRMITLALIGIVIIYGAFAIVSTVISGQFTS